LMSGLPQIQKNTKKIYVIQKIKLIVNWPD